MSTLKLLKHMNKSATKIINVSVWSFMNEIELFCSSLICCEMGTNLTIEEKIELISSKQLGNICVRLYRFQYKQMMHVGVSLKLLSMFTDLGIPLLKCLMYVNVEENPQLSGIFGNLICIFAVWLYW